MKIERGKSRLIVKDQPLVFWIFYSCFVFGGMAALILALATAPDKKTALIVSIIGIGNIAGGVYMIRREPASILIFDSETGNLLVRRWHFTARRDSYYPLTNISSVRIEMTEHSEGGYVYRPSLCLNDSATIPVSLFWYQTKQKSEMIVSEIQYFLNLSGLPASRKTLGVIPAEAGIQVR